MSFGFSVGDLVAVRKLMSEITISLTATTWAGSEYQELIREIGSLRAALHQVEQLESGTIPSSNLTSIVLSCAKPLEEFLAHIKTYESAVGVQRQSNAVEGASKKIRMLLRLEELQSYLHLRNDDVNNLLTEHGLEKLAELDVVVPTVPTPQPEVLKKERVVGFYRDPIESISRPVNTSESWACYHFERHARKCAHCHNPYEVHRNREQLCNVGHRLAQEVAKFLYNKSDGNTYSSVEEDGKLVQVEIPVAYVEVNSLLKAIERSLRHRSRRPFVTMDRSYYIAPRAPASPTGTSTDAAEEPVEKKTPRPRSGEIIDWPEYPYFMRKLEMLDDYLNEEDSYSNHFRRRARALKATAHNTAFSTGIAAYSDVTPVSELEPRLGLDIEDSKRLDEDEDDYNPNNTTKRNTIQQNTEVNDTKALALIPWDSNSDHGMQGNHRESAYTSEQVWTHSMPEKHTEDEADASSDEGSVFSKKSLASSATDMSKGTGFSPMQIATATQKLIAILQDDEVMQPLYTTAVHGKIGPRRFAKKFHRLLRAYSANLKEEATESLDMLAAQLVAYRAKHVAEAISEKFQDTMPPSLVDDEIPDLDVKHASSSKELEQDETEQEKEDDEQKDAGVDENVLEKLTDIQEFLVGGTAIVELRTSLLQFVFPSESLPKRAAADSANTEVEYNILDLPYNLQEIILSTPRDKWRLCSENNHAQVNKIKTVIEDYTQQEWDWWPLSPRTPDLDQGQIRLEWVLCGISLFQIISSSDADILEAIMPTAPQHPKHCHCCYTDGQRVTWGKMCEQIFSRFTKLQSTQNTCAPSSTPKLSDRYTPTGSTQTIFSSSPASPQNSVGSGMASGSTGNGSPQVQGQVTSASSSNDASEAQRILFGVQGSRWSLDLEQIHMSSIDNDPAFFRELKIRYRKHRGLFKRTASPFRFRFCKFVKFEKFDTERILSQGEDLPDYPGVEQDYEYAPRPGTNPMISPKTFAVCLQVCDAKCKWPLLNPWHDCIRLPCRSYRLRCIPKKKSEFDLQSDDIGIVAWGLEADYAISFAFIAVYHLVPLLAALGFWIYWLVRFPGDWQNAAVPVLTVLALFAVLWMPFGKHISAMSST